jgi:hypothetical protein
MGWATSYIQQLKEGQTVKFRPRGHSMRGKIDSGQLCTVVPLSAVDAIAVGDIVLCKVNGAEYLHLVKAIRGQQYQSETIEAESMAGFRRTIFSGDASAWSRRARQGRRIYDNRAPELCRRADVCPTDAVVDPTEEIAALLWRSVDQSNHRPSKPR